MSLEEREENVVKAAQPREIIRNSEPKSSKSQKIMLIEKRKSVVGGKADRIKNAQCSWNRKSSKRIKGNGIGLFFF